MLANGFEMINKYEKQGYEDLLDFRMYTRSTVSDRTTLNFIPEMRVQESIFLNNNIIH